jgi:DNA-binding transcriptional LysR family regulator
MRSDFLTLKLFVAICEEESIAKAADREHIAASAVSKRIADLEDDLKISLFERHARGLEPLPAADVLLNHARGIMRDLAIMESDLADLANGLHGTVRVHSSLSAIIQHLPRDLSDFLALHPTIRIELEETLSQKAVRAVADNAADIGIFGGSANVPGMKTFPYRTDRLVVLMPTQHPLAERRSLTLRDLLPYDLIGPQKGSFLDILLAQAEAELGQQLKLRIRVYGFETVRSMVESNMGIGLVPDKCAKHYIATHKLVAVALDEAWAERQWQICVRDVRSLSSPARLLVDYLSRV